MKRLVVCCDGTWQSLNNVYPTNVLKLAQSIVLVARDAVLTRSSTTTAVLVKRRWRDIEAYEPPNLKPFEQFLDDWSPEPAPGAAEGSRS